MSKSIEFRRAMSSNTQLLATACPLCGALVHPHMLAEHAEFHGSDGYTVGGALADSDELPEAVAD